MKFFQETKRSLRLYVIFLSIGSFIIAFTEPYIVGELMALLLIYCAIKFDYLLTKNVGFLITILVVVFVYNLMQSVYVAEQIQWLRAAGYVVFFSYVVVQIIRVHKKLVHNNNNI